MATPADSPRPDPTARLNVLLPGLYAWVTTVAYPAAHPGAPLACRVAAGLALIALVAGPLVAARRARLGRAVGIFGFLVPTVAAWVFAGPLISAERVDPVRAAAGALGWGLFVLGWGSVRKTGFVPEEDPRALPGDELPARAELPRGAVLVLALAVAGAVLPALLAWRVVRAEHALLAQAVALACGIATVSVGAEIALLRGRWRPIEPPAQRLSRAAVPLTLLGIVLVVGLVKLVAG